MLMSSRPHPRVRLRPVLSHRRHIGMGGPSAVCHRLWAIGVVALLPSLLGAQAPPPPALSQIAFVGVSVVNVETGAIEPNQTVVVVEGSIVRFQRGDQVLRGDVTGIPARGR